MSKKHNQIGQQLHQGGLPASMAQAVAKWLGTQTVSESGVIGPDSPEATDPNWQNQFRPPESPPLPGVGGPAGDDGIGGNVGGEPGLDPNTPNYPGQPGFGGGSGGGGTININDNTMGWNPTDLTPLIARITRLEEQMADVQYRLTIVEECCRGVKRRMDDLERIMGQLSREVNANTKRSKENQREILNAVEC